MFQSALFSLAILAASPSQSAVMQGGWISDADYPAAALSAGQQGAVQVRFLINAAGAVSQCNVASTSGSAALDARSCEIVMQRFRFKPASDANGKAVEEWRSQKVSWKLPAAAATAAASGYTSARLKAEVRVDVAKDGGVESCEVITSSGDRKFDATACAVLTRTTKLEPKRNEKGRPMRTVMVVPVWQ
jgi:TonB family protein